MPPLKEHVQEFERYMGTSTNLLPRMRARYAYEVRCFAEIMEVSRLEDITAALLLEWNTVLLRAGAAAHTMWGNDPPCGAVTSRERSALGNTAAG
jgi:hypothetical protein